MENKVDFRINSDDLRMLKLISKSNYIDNLQKDMINALGDIYGLLDDYVQTVAVLTKRKKYIANTFLNVFKSGLFPVVSMLISEAILNKDIEGSYAGFTCLFSGLIGFELFQKLNESDNYIDEDTYQEMLLKIDVIDAEINYKIHKYLEAVSKYFALMDDFVVKDEVKKAFASNCDYINSQIENGRFKEDFSFESMLEIADSCFDDELIKSVLEEKSSNKKQRKL